MKYWRGYLTAAVFAFFSWALIEFASTHSVLIDMVYPYITRMLQGFLVQWSSGADFLLWQLFAILLGVGLITSIVLMIVLRWNPIQWLGWVIATASLLFFLHTVTYGLNGYAGSIADDIRMNMTEYTLGELEEATRYYQNKANELADQVPRNPDGSLDFSDFSAQAQQAGEGFQNLVYNRSFSIFAGPTQPIKELGWADMYTSMGITGFTMALTGEAAVNPQIPAVSIPFTMCHEMAHRMCISAESDANFAAFLACQENPSIQFQYSAYFMAYRYCYNAIASLNTTQSQEAVQRIKAGLNANFSGDLLDYNQFFAENKKESAEKVANKVNDTYIKVNGDDRGVASYGAVCDLLVSWHIQEIVLPSQTSEDLKFDPFDESQVDLSGIVNAPVQENENENADDSQ